MTQHFISHNAVDAEEAARLRRDLLACRPNDVVALSSDPGAGPQGGTAWQSWIRRTLESADVVLFLASEKSLSPWCSAELGMARLLGTPIVSLLTAPDAVVNPVVAHLQAVPLDQPIDDLVRVIDGVVGSSASSAPTALPAGVVPYPGLAPLTEEHEALLQGRAVERDRILADLDRLAAGPARFVVVSGPSGSGKSSLVRAGVIPRLKAAGWAVTGPTQPRQLRLRGIPALDGGAGEPSLVVVDQFEEMVELDHEPRERIVRWLHDAVDAGTSVVLVVRSEFRTAIGEWIPKPIDHYVPFLAVEDLYDIVRVPAKLAQLHVPEQLVDRLVHETGSGSALPLLAFTLHELWEARDLVEVALQESTLDRLGGVRGVLAHRAEEALRAAGDGEPATADRVLALLSRLASPESNPPTRAPVRVRSITDEERGWLDEFVRVGLVSYRTSYALDDRLGAGVRPTGDDLADVTHEALFSWSPLAAAIDAQREHNRMRLDIEQSARRWDESERRDDTLLLAGDRLAFARRTALGASDPLLHAYVAASLRHDRDRRVRRALAVAVAVVAVLAVAGAVVAVVQRGRAEAARRDADAARVVAQSVRVAAQANQEIAAQRDVAMVTAAVAHSIDDNPDTEGALMNALATPVGPVRYFADRSADWSTLRLLGDGTAVVASATLQPATVDLVSRATTELAPVDLEVADVRSGHDGRVVVHGRVPPAAWAVAVIDRATASVSVATHDVEVAGVADHAAGVVFGDAGGGVWFAPYEGDALGTPVEIDRHDGASITDVAVAGDWLATASRRGIRLQQRSGDDWASPVAVLDVPAGTRAAERVVLVPAGDDVHVYAAGSDPTIRHWLASVDGAVEQRALGRHAGVVNALAVDPAGTVLFTGGRGGQIERWDLGTGAPLGEPLRAHRSPVRHLSAASATSIVSTADDVAILWDLAPTRVVERPGVVPPAWRDEQMVALVSGDGPLAAVTADGRIVVADGTELGAPPSTRRAWWVGDDRLVVETGDTGQLDMPPLDVWLLDDSGAEPIASGADAIDVGRCLAVVATGPTLSFEAVGGEAAGCGPAPAPVALERGDVADVALDPDEQRVLVVHRDNEVEVRTLDGEVTASVARRHGIVPTAAVWVSDDRVAIGHDVGAPIELVDLVSGEAVEVGSHDDAVWWLAVDTDRGRLVSAGQDGLLMRTDLERATPVGAPMVGARRIEENDPTAVVRGLRLLDDGVLLAIHGDQLVAWEVDPSRLRERACHDAQRALTEADLDRLGADPSAAPCG